MNSDLHLLDEKNIQECIEMLDTDGDGKIDFSEFCIWMAVIPHEQNVIEDMIKEAFCQLNQDINDPDGNGFITLDVFKKILKENIDNEKIHSETEKIIKDQYLYTQLHLENSVCLKNSRIKRG